MAEEKVVVSNEVKLLEAAAKGDKNQCEALLKNGVNIDCCDAQGRTPVYWAASNNHMPTLQLLMEKGAKIDVADTDYLATVIHAAAYNDSLDTLKILLKANKDQFLEVKNNANNTPLMTAASANSPKVASYLIETKANVKTVNDLDMTLIIAAIHGTDSHKKTDLAEILSLFIKAGVDVNHQQQKHQNDTALVAAVYRGNYEAVKLLLEGNAQIDKIAGPCHASPLAWAACRGDLRMTQLLINNKATINLRSDMYDEKDATPLFHVIYGASREPMKFPPPFESDARLKIAELLVKNGADIDQMATNCINALGIAAYLGQKEMVKLLLNSGAMTELPCSYHKIEGTPCEIAEKMGHKETVTLLNEYKLLEAAKKGNTELCETLLHNNVNIECCDAQGRTPLYFAAQYNHAATLDFLIQRKAIVNVVVLPCDRPPTTYFESQKYLKQTSSNIIYRKTNDCQSSPIHAAAYTNSIDTLTLLLAYDNNKNLELRSSDNNTPLMSAAFGNSPKAAALLLSKGAHVGVINDEDMTPIIAAIHGAKKHKKTDIQEILTLFINAGVDVNHQNVIHRDTALVAACAAEYSLVAKLLLDNHANPNQVAGLLLGSPLHWAAIRCDMRSVRFLIDAGADVNLTCDFYGMKNTTPLFHLINAVSMGAMLFHMKPIERVELASFLIDSGADIDQMCDGTINALGIAAYLGQAEMVRLLLDSGAMTEVSCSYQGTEGTPCEIAEKRSHKGIVALFKAHKANLDAKILANSHRLRILCERLSSKVIELEQEVLKIKKDTADQQSQISLLTEKLSRVNQLTLPGTTVFFSKNIPVVNKLETNIETPSNDKNSEKEKDTQRLSK